MKYFTRKGFHLIDTTLFLHNLETDLFKEMEKFECEVYDRWFILPEPNTDTIYKSCPYFRDIDKFFETGLMRIANIAFRRYHEFSGESIDLSWHAVCGDYPEIIEVVYTPYSDAFEAVSSKGLDRLREAKAKLESASSGRVHGYITNSLGYALLQETINAISGTLKSIENDSIAWQRATAPQLMIHKRLAVLWHKNYKSVFMERVKLGNKSVVSAIIERFCLSFGYTYEKYLEIKTTQEFDDALQEYTEAQEYQKKMQAHYKAKVQNENLDKLNNEIRAIDRALENIGSALWGEKKAKKQALQKRRETVSAEIQAILHPISLQSTYTAYISHSSPQYTTFKRNLDTWLNSKEYWRFVYSEKYKDYVAYTPNNEPMFTLGQGFVQKYGRFRKIGAKFEGCSWDNFKTHIAEYVYAIFEIEE